MSGTNQEHNVYVFSRLKVLKKNRAGRAIPCGNASKYSIIRRVHCSCDTLNALNLRVIMKNRHHILLYDSRAPMGFPLNVE